MPAGIAVVTPTTWFDGLAALRANERLAIVGTHGEWTGTEMLRVAAKLASFLADLGTPSREPVPALLAGTPTAYALAVAGASVGQPLAPLAPLHTLSELTACLETLTSPVLLTDPPSAEVGSRVAAAVGSELVLVPEFEPGGEEVALDAKPDDPVIVIHTSGTSGRPKPVLYRQRHLAERSRLLGELCSLDPSSVFATASPFHHIGGFGTAAAGLAAGATLVPVGRFDPRVWRRLGDLGVTHALAVPTVVDLLLEQEILCFPTLRVLAYGGAPMHPKTVGAVLEVAPHLDLVQLFGQTEGSPLTCLSPDDHRLAAGARPELLGSVGRVVPGVELRISEPGADGVGEVVARGAHLAGAGEDRWLHTGDLGTLDDGYLFLAGRLGDRIVRGGENVDPLEVELVIGAQPGIREVAVVGMPDRRWGEVIAAAVVSQDASDPPDFPRLRVATRQCLAGFKVPAVWHQVAELPRNSAGKIDRRAVRAMLVNQREHGRADSIDC